MPIETVATVLAIIGTIGGFLSFIATKISKAWDRKSKAIEEKTKAEMQMSATLENIITSNAELKKFMGTIENDTDANKSDIKELITNQKEQRKDIDTNTADIKELRTFIHSETRQIRERCDRIHKVV